MYGDVVLDVNHGLFEDALEDFKLSSGLFQDTELTAEQLAKLTDGYKQIVLDETGAPFPQDPVEQLWGAVGAVFASWMNNRAITYRRLNDIPAAWGTAVNVQAMVFGNMGRLRNRCRLSPVTRQLAKICFMANFWSMRRVRMWLLVFAHRYR